jgi:hypothetical protein
VAPAEQAAILWLDRLVMNPDRTTCNPNLLWWSGHLWPIDHGACLGFQYAWGRVTEASPREPRLMPDAHLFESGVPRDDLRAADETLAPRLNRDVLEAAVAAVPESFLRPLLGIGENAEPGSRVARRRAAYVAFLWKRLTAPRPFLEAR